MASKKGRTVNARAGGIARMRPKRERLAKRAEFKARMLEMFAQGRTQTQMQKALGMSHGFTNALYHECLPEWLAGARERAALIATEHLFKLDVLADSMASLILGGNARISTMKGGAQVIERADFEVIARLTGPYLKVLERMAKHTGSDAPRGSNFPRRPA